MIEFPKWKYNQTKTSLIVDNKSQESELGTGWTDRPVEISQIDSTEITVPVELPVLDDPLFNPPHVSDVSEIVPSQIEPIESKSIEIEKIKPIESKSINTTSIKLKKRKTTLERSH